MVSWRLSLFVFVALFVVLTLDVEARRGGRGRGVATSNTEDGEGETSVVTRRRGGRRRGNRGGGEGTEVSGGDGEDGRPGRDGAGGRRRGGRRRQGGRPGRRGGQGRGRGNRRGGRRREPGAGGRRRGGGGRRRGGHASESLLTNYANSNGKFGFDVYRHMANQEGDNFVFSPFGVYTTVSISLMAANGQTKRQLVRALHVHSPVHAAFRVYNTTLTYGNSTDTRMMMATGLYKQSNIQTSPRFLRKLQGFYLMGATNFHATDPASGVNSFVSRVTLNEIADFFGDGEITDDDLIVLLNGIFFKGKWEEGFDTSDSQVEDFTTLESGVVSTNMMSCFGNFRHKSVPALEASVLEVPYKGNKFAFYIILPDPDKTLADVESNLNHDLVNQTIHELNDPAPFSLKMPSFSMDTTKAMKTILQSIGIHEIFQQGAAKLRRMTTHRNAFVSKLKHRAVLRIDESGDPPSSISEADNEFNVNRPFIFIVRDKQAHVNLLMGRFVNPEGDDVSTD